MGSLETSSLDVRSTLHKFDSPATDFLSLGLEMKCGRLKRTDPRPMVISPTAMYRNLGAPFCPAKCDRGRMLRRDPRL